MPRKWWSKLLLAFLTGLATATFAGHAVAQEADVEALMRRIERLERALEAKGLEAKLGTPVATENAGAVDARTVEDIVGSYLQRQAEAKKKDEAKKEEKKDKEPEFVAVGSDMNMKAQWNNGMWFYSPNKDFQFHVRGRIQQDWGWFSPSESLEPRGWHDGAEFRRARLGVQGSAWEVLQYTVEWDFADGFGTVSATDIYMDVTQLPVVGNFRAGHFYEPFSLEEFATSDLYITFMERSVASDAFSPGRNIGAMLFNNVDEGLFTWGAGVFRPNSAQNASAEDSGDGEYAYTGRLTFNPWYAHNGRCMFMLGGAYSYRSFPDTPDRPDAANPALVGLNNTARFRTRIPLRVNGTTGVNSERVVDSGSLVCDNVQLFNLQSLLILGSFSLQSEAYWVHVRDALEGDMRINPHYSGFYVEASYFLTGENRRYKRSTATIDRPIPHEPFFFVKNHDGERKYLFGRGAWELVARYEYIDLGNDIVTSDFQGREQDIIVGLNWWLNPNFRMQFNYIWAEIDGLNTLTINQSGNVHAFGARFQWDW
jgi:phosphate-selective porin OprO/OprP